MRVALAEPFGFGELQAHEHLDRAGAAGEIPDEPIIDAQIPTASDDSLAPPGCHILSILAQHFPYRLSRGRSWDDMRGSVADLLVERMTRFIPNLKSLIVGRLALSPMDLERTYGLTGGDVYHGRLDPDQVFSLRPHPRAARYVTPVPGLYLCGTGAHPGGGVSGAPGTMPPTGCWPTSAAGRARERAMFEGSWRDANPAAPFPTLDIARVGDAWHLTWHDRAGAARSGCGLAEESWIYGCRTPADAEGGRASGTAAEFDSRSGVIVYQPTPTGEWPTRFYHPRDAGSPTAAMSAGAPRQGLEGSFQVGYESKSGERHDAITATIARHDQRYLFSWAKAGEVLYQGVGLAQGPRFGAAWGLPGFDHEVLVAHLDANGSLACVTATHGRAGTVKATYGRT